MNDKITIYTDGACRGNPGPGGWGAVIVFPDGSGKEIKAATEETTNNRMELSAAIEALRLCPPGAKVELYTDSVYLREGMENWLKKWRERNWRTAGKKPVKNRDLWSELDRQQRRLKVNFHWVRGHSGLPGNERADALANEAIDDFLAGGKSPVSR